MVFFFDFAVTFWSGSQFINDHVTNHAKGRNYMFADVITPFLAMMMSSFELGHAVNSIKAFNLARHAGYNVF